MLRPYYKPIYAIDNNWREKNNLFLLWICTMIEYTKK